MTLRARLTLAILAAGTIGAGASAQKVVWPPTGPLYRYNGDTIWVEHDSTSMRVVYRGDTITKTTTVNRAVTYSTVYVVSGDSARLVDSRDALGAQRTEEIGRSVPNMIATSERSMLQSAIRSEASWGQMNELRARAAQMGREMPSTEPPSSPEPALTYAVSNSVSIVQHRDTALYVRGCVGRGKLDTTTFVFRGDTAVDRLSPARTFGQAMVVTLVSTMFNTNVRLSLASREPTRRLDVPSGPNQCASATPAPLIGERALYSVGSIRRFHNDTVWAERDTSAIRTIFRGDTVMSASFMNGLPRSAMVYVIDGDSARIIDTIDGNGTHKTDFIGRTQPVFLLLADRQMMMSGLSTADQQAGRPMPLSLNSAATTGGANPVPHPPSPAQSVTYDPTPKVRMIQHGDTLRYIRGCPMREPADTTVFIFFGADSVKRQSPPRMFGPPMVASLLGQIQMTTVRQSIASRDAQLATGLPRAPDPAAQCAR